MTDNRHRTPIFQGGDNNENSDQKPHPVSEGHKFCDKDHTQQIDNSSTVLEKIAGLYAERLLSDITLEVGGKKFAAHRLILCASSDVFQVMLMNPNWTESQETKIVLQEDPACVLVFPDFLKYLYTGKIHINHFLVLPLVTLADKYNVKDLVRLCVDYMCRHVVSATKHNQLVSWLQYTLNCGHTAVHNACSNFITWNFELAAQMDDFGCLETDVLIHFLQKSELVVKDELTLFQCVAKWLQFQEHRLKSTYNLTEAAEHFADLAVEVMSHIRFPMMTPRHLASLLIHSLTSRFKDFFFEHMAVAMSFHSGEQGLRFWKVLEDPDGHLFFTPRLYTTERWSASLIIENYPLLPTYSVRTLVFNTPASFAECQSDHTYEWTVDIYPKGVWFKKFYLIVWQGTLEMPESVDKTVRLSLTSKDTEEVARVSVGILIGGKQDGMEHVRKVVKRNFVFSKDERILNINDLIPYDDLNNLRTGRSPFLVGPNSDVLKLHIVITPLWSV
ncbi:BTB/POZ domain-containing protein 17-like [Limulus polyphemus]|uniref:BTB/POZ domain-containing protein 17-like n=1 Tax=Limulus polyphemus TaxID=6850 RepID=A0ABM1SMZ6_LIMPO|nr:BTB/POZ domain-containing protein 17-like [Limulus polyphemus]XP_013777481.1 BTB/POZ domain-containing protein 17-like [Limulus polyphemus]XP_013777482.1 BTB/POZ domain-containing protein 17-like [Limulus polyphemus]XP_022245002.1 BTB/POZ domain-containing protein 17-like [Limulus polyphemus]XP_022245003.1 BTB/POZ domain-containing protein 17-like [Limulus polyphemus]